MINAFYDEGKDITSNVKALFSSVASIITVLLEKESTKNQKIIYAGGAASGKVLLPEDFGQYTLFLAVVGNEPIVCAKYQSIICGTGTMISNNTQTKVTGIISGRTLNFTATAALNLLQVIF